MYPLHEKERELSYFYLESPPSQAQHQHLLYRHEASPPFLPAAAPGPVSRLIAGFHAPCHNSTDHVALLLLVGLSGFLTGLKLGDDRNCI